MAESLFEDMFADVPRALPEAAAIEAPHVGPAIAGIMPLGFRLDALLAFLPDVRLKKELDRLAADAAVIDVREAGGLGRADACAGLLRDKLKEVATCFEMPCDLSNQLHKRMTGLRSEFTSKASAALDQLNRAIKARQRELDALAEKERLAAQARADAEQREAAKQALAEAKAAGAPKAVVRDLREQAKSATAPPVPTPVLAEPLTRSAVGDKWKARPKGSTDDDEPNPTTACATPAQLEGIRELMRAAIDGRVPMTVFEVDWPKVNTLARNERTAMRVPGMEAFNEGLVRRVR